MTGPQTSAIEAVDHRLLAMVATLCVLCLLTGTVIGWIGSRRSRHRPAEAACRDVEDKLARVQAHHQAFVELSAQVLWVADKDAAVTEVNSTWEQLVGLPSELAKGDGWLRVLHPDDVGPMQRLWKEAAAEGAPVDFRHRIRAADGNYVWVRGRARLRRDAAGHPIAWYGSLENIHDQVMAEVALRESEERYRLASRATSDIIWDWSVAEGLKRWAGAYREILGYTDLDRGTDYDWWQSRIAPDDLPRVLESQARALGGTDRRWSEEYRFRTQSGEYIHVRSRSLIIRDACGKPVRIVGSMADITERKKAEAELERAAFHDPLTRLPNRALYLRRLREAIARAERSGGAVALIVLDVNSFKEINDTLGHRGGDEVLIRLSERLQAHLLPSCTVARLGGDEFAVILPNLADAQAFHPLVDILAAQLADTITVDSLIVPISVSAGIAVWPRDATDPDTLLTAADLALYDAKTDAPGTFREYTPVLRTALERRMGMLAAARRGLAERRILAYYQPKVELETGRIMGWEALLRMVGEDGSIRSPADIEAAFCDAEITVSLTDAMLAQVFADMAHWRDAGLDVGRVAINLSAGDFRKQTLANRIRRCAARYGQSLSALDLEVTEGVLIGQLGPDVSRMLEELRAEGVLVALDDFGTGYASLTHLQRFPVDVIKIDKTFIDRIGGPDPKASAVTDAILDMAQRLQMQTVAEGIETVEQAVYLRERGCTIGQGYLFSRPMPATQVPIFLSNHRPENARFGG
ncbi:putative bifunctional diguanylate cyclase/phosphodiesterase [Aureimonas frigidaquae]|uniref:Diguanylate cyclase/phosphodiesterase with PAS/PAC sensor n=1 Tax=Aureimonas frigidaquae TaxID=424757 RepID=A0A0P0Z3N9_9HYPH|nr:GGDEF domain-containing phosphodiesterase [Aureimonas frigidaquae]BAT28660.1 diguanylate cyclase/phosphodiesterase with PAS/PAC sensor [Aureimonas frigidaquae]